MPTPSPTRVRSVIAVAIGGTLAALVTIFALAPAQWADDGVRRISDGHVRLAETAGTIWNGSGTLVFASGQSDREAGASLPEPLSWRLDPLALLFGTMELTLHHPSALSGPWHVSAYLNGRLHLGAVALRLPAAMLAGLGAPWNTVRPGGIISLRTDGIELAHNQCSGSVTAEWEDASSALTPVAPIGHYLLQTSGHYPGMEVRLQTVAGPLELEGSGTIGAGGHLQFEGIARAQATADPATKTQLTGLISLLGRRDGDAAILRVGS